MLVTSVGIILQLVNHKGFPLFSSIFHVTHKQMCNRFKANYYKLHCYFLVLTMLYMCFSGVLQFFVLRDYAREALSLRWRSWMTGYYMKRYFRNQTFYKIQSQSIIDNPDQRIVDDLSSFTGTALSFSLTLFNAAVDLISFSNILYGIYPPLFVVLLVYSLGGTAISVFLGKVTLCNSTTLELSAW